MPRMGRFAWGNRWHDWISDHLARASTLHQDLVSTVLECANEQPVRHSLHCVDLGCGSGRLIGSLASVFQSAGVPARLIGMDACLDRFVCERQIERVGAFDSVDFLCADMTNFPLTDASLDIVVSSLAMHHLTDAGRTNCLRECYRVLRPSGRLMVTDCCPGTNPLMRFLSYNVALADGFTRTRQNRKRGLTELIEVAGFQRVKSTKRYSTACGSVEMIVATR